jgi:hypothetical protein
VKNVLFHIKGRKDVGHWWLTPVILASWEAEIKRIKVPGQLGQKSLQDPIPTGKSWAW